MDSPQIGNLKDSFNTATVYYGVYTPNDDSDWPNVFQDKLEALKVAKKNKKSRFKPFQFYHEAAEFALKGCEFPNNNTTTVNGSLQPKITTEPVQAIGEKASPFKGPKPQELVELRKAIENGNYKAVRDTIWQNPRYLVSSGDTPSILQEGPRYNALHVAAKAKNAEMTELILMTVSNTEFIKLLYGDDNQQNAEHRTTVLLDLYLNTPNKGLNETPLHFASKYGAPDVVEVLVSYPQCDKTLKNKFQKTADQIICERTEGENLTAIRKKIEILLQDSYYVPVLRAEDNSMPPIIGVPFSPTSPPVLNVDPLSPRLEIHAYAGPMNKKGADEFRRVWKTPPRSLSFSSPNRRKPSEVINVSALRFKDHEKGLERIGKKLASRYDVNWKEYWPFLDSFIDIASDEGLNLLEGYLSNRYAIHSNSFAEEVKTTPPVLKSDPTSPISNLCAAFSACRLSDSADSQGCGDQKSETDSTVYIDKACQVFANRISNDILYIWCGEHNTLQVLETEIRQLELLITSYMDDVRFSSINFQKIHSRLGRLIGEKLCNNIKDDVRVFLCEKIENILDKVTKSVDCFSSDDEGHNLKEVSESRKPTIYKKQLICLIHYILNVLCRNYERVGGGDEGVRDWESAEACNCVYHVRRAKKNSLSRSGSFKNSAKARLEAEGISKKLCFDNSNEEQNFVRNGINLSLDHSQIEISSDDDDDDHDDDKFYTPPSSPSLLVDLESEDEFNDTELPEHDIFIEGDFPTKLDSEVFNAINYAECTLDSNKYPNIYRWHHCVSLYAAAERESWPSSKDIKAKPASPCSSLVSLFPADSPKTSTPSKSWLRITGANSPRAIFKSYSINT